jgi:hypothetical protein
MTLKLDGQPVLLQVAVWVCALGFVISFFTAFFTQMVILTRTEATVDRPEDRALSWGERAARKESRLNKFHFAEEFRSLRRLSVAGWTGTFVSLGLLLLLTSLFGE